MAHARRLRDALFRVTSARAAGAGPAPADLGVLNATAAHPPLVPSVGPDGGRRWAPGCDGAGLLSTVARDAVELLTGPFGHRVRACASDDCAWSTSTPPGPAAAAGARWSTAATSTKYGRCAHAGRGRVKPCPAGARQARRWPAVISSALGRTVARATGRTLCPGTVSSRQARVRVAIAVAISVIAKWSPMHLCLPAPKGRKAPSGRAALHVWSSQRSGSSS